MANGINRVTLIGNLGNDPDCRSMPDGKVITTLSVATSEAWKDKQTGEQKEVTEWHRVVFFGKLGEIAGDYLKKGSKVYVEGKLKTRKWQDKQNIERYTTEIIGNDLQMLDSRTNPAGGSVMGEREPGAAPGAGSAAPSYAGDLDDIPFIRLKHEYCY